MPLATLQESNRNSFSLRKSSSKWHPSSYHLIQQFNIHRPQSAFRTGRANNKRPKAMPPQCTKKWFFFAENQRPLKP